MADDQRTPEAVVDIADAARKAHTWGTGMFREFRTFLLRGNVIDLAVAVIAGAAFGAVVTSLVKDVITPLIAAIGGKPDFSSVSFHIGHGTIMIGTFLNTVVSFVLIMASVFFLIVKPVNLVTKRLVSSSELEPTVRECPECLTSIPVNARRCSACTSHVEPLPA